MSLLPENQLPAVLAELPPPRIQPAPAADAAPVAATPHPSQPRANPVPDPTPQPDQSPRKGRNHFTKQEDELLTQYVKICDDEGMHVNGNKIYIKFAAMVSSHCTCSPRPITDHHQYPNHSMHSWRDRWVRHLSKRHREEASDDEEDEEDEEAGHEPAPRRSNPLPANRPRPQGPPARAPQRPPRDPPRPTATARAAVPPPSTAAAPNPGRRAAAQPSGRLQDLARKRARIQAARTIQRIWRGYRLRNHLEDASEAIAALQARAQGFLTRTALGFGPDEMEREPEDTPWFTAVERGPPREDPLLPEDGLEEADGLDEEADGLGQEEAELDEADPATAARVAAAPAAASATAQRTAPAAPEDALNISKEDFWCYFNQFRDVDGIALSPWIQIGPSVVDFWDLWRHATAEPHHATRDWELVTENLGLNWVVEPHLPLLVKAAFEKHLLGFEERLLELMESGLLDDLEEAEETGEGGEDDEREDVEEEGEQRGQEADEESASEELDANFVSSPPVAGLKRLRSSSALTPIAVNKRARYDPSSEIPCTPDSRTKQPAQPPTEPETQDSPLAAHLDGAEDYDDLTPSRQLRFEIEEFSPAKRTSRKPQRVVPSSANQPFPSVEHDDDDDDDDYEASDSSDAFESPSKLPIRNLPPRRNLPWSTANQPVITQPPPRQTPKPTRPNPSPSPFASTSASVSSSAPLDPTPILNHFLAMHYPPSHIARALRATTTHILPSNSLVHIVLEALARGGDVPVARQGVWTDRDDEKLRGVGRLVDRLERGESIPSSVGGDERKEVLRGLVTKHGRESVAGRWRYLKAWERA